MGYDMSLVQVPERLRDTVLEHRKLEARWSELLDRPDHDVERQAVSAALSAHRDPTCFRVSAGWMGSLRETMRDAGMLACASTPEWRHDASWSPYGDLGVDDRGLRIFGWTDEYAAERGYRPDGDPGIAHWKLRSNDDWIVTAAECAEAVAAWESLSAGRRQELEDRDLGTDFWDRWLDFLRLGADGDGFYVE